MTTMNELFAKLDDILDGKPIMIVDSPQLRRSLRKRQMERALEARDDFMEVLANHQAKKLLG
jgi:hypothetical protein